jgi:hypothetical protein
MTDPKTPARTFDDIYNLMTLRTGRVKTIIELIFATEDYDALSPVLQTMLEQLDIADELAAPVVPIGMSAGQPWEGV